MWVGVSCVLDDEVLKVGDLELYNYIDEGDGVYVVERAMIEEGAKSISEAYEEGDEPFVRLKVEGEKIVEYEYFWFNDIRWYVEGLISPDVIYAEVESEYIIRLYRGGVWDTKWFSARVRLRVDEWLSKLGYTDDYVYMLESDDGNPYRVESEYWEYALKRFGEEMIENMEEGDELQGFYELVRCKGKITVEDMDLLGVDYEVSRGGICVYLCGWGSTDYVRVSCYGDVEFGDNYISW